MMRNRSVRTFRTLASRYGWTPQQIADMTPAQTDAYLADPAYEKKPVPRGRRRR